MKLVSVDYFLDNFNDTDAIQQAVDYASKNNATVIIPKTNKRNLTEVYEIDKPIVLKSNTSIILDGCRLRLADESFTSIFVNEHVEYLKEDAYKHTDKNISIIGRNNCCLDGGKYNGLCEMNCAKLGYSIDVNHLINFVNVKNIVISGINVVNQRHWAFCFRLCSYAKITDIHFDSEGDVPNQDGIDLRLGCNHFVIENISGCTGDDVIALTGLTEGARYFLPKISTDICYVKINNVNAYGVCGNALIRLLNHDGIKLHHVKISNVTETSPYSKYDYPVAINPDNDKNIDKHSGYFVIKNPIQKGEHGYRLSAAIRIGENFWYKKEKAKLGETYKIKVENVKTHARIAVCINATLKDALFTNFSLFGNAYMSAYFGMGDYENLKFDNFIYDNTVFKVDDDKKINIEWNATKTTDYYAINFYKANINNVSFENFSIPIFMRDFTNEDYTGKYNIKNIKL